MVRVDSLKIWALVLTVIFAVSTFVMIAFAPGARAQDIGCKGQIVLDAGHGGADTGASNSTYGLLEKDQNLQVAYALKSLLQQDGYTVCMTRTGDETLSNNDRYTYANTTGAKVLVSIHMNGASDPSIDYTTTLYGKPKKDTELANAVLGGLYPALGIPKRAPYQFASGVLLKSNMPAIIAETVFITSDKEGQLLSDGTGARQQQIAGALRTGIENYLKTH